MPIALAVLKGLDLLLLIAGQYGPLVARLRAIHDGIYKANAAGLAIDDVDWEEVDASIASKLAQLDLLAGSPPSNEV
jgi:hypothetical protein